MPPTGMFSGGSGAGYEERKLDDQGYAAAPALQDYPTAVQHVTAFQDTAAPPPGACGGIDIVQNYPEVSVAAHVGEPEGTNMEIEQSMGESPPVSNPYQQEEQQEEKQQKQPQQSEGDCLLGLTEEVKGSIVI